MEGTMKRKIIILGCTGSIGTTALNALEALTDRFEIVGLSAHSSFEELVQIASRWHCPTMCLSQDKKDDRKHIIPMGTEWYEGRKGLLEMIRQTEADMVLNGIAGSSGLEPTFAAIESGKDVALANKESIVMAGDILFAHAKAYGVKIIPVDSEHSTLHALIEAHGVQQVDRLVITASGGPFRTMPADRMESITVAMAIAHPTWDMGAKISIDSSTLANKGLEVIEASYLFGFSDSEIEVVIHPQSVVHSLIRLKNGALYAQLSPPDMALPIMSALADKEIPLTDIVEPLDFTDLTLQFNKPDFDRFPLLALAYKSVARKGGYPIAFNAANEVAVQAFMAERIKFVQIASVVAETLDSDWSGSYRSLDDVVSIDASARAIAQAVVERFAR